MRINGYPLDCFVLRFRFCIYCEEKKKPFCFTKQRAKYPPGCVSGAVGVGYSFEWTKSSQFKRATLFFLLILYNIRAKD